MRTHTDTHISKYSLKFNATNKSKNALREYNDHAFSIARHKKLRLYMQCHHNRWLVIHNNKRLVIHQNIVSKYER